MDFSQYDKLLLVYILTIITSIALFYGLIILLFLILKWCKLVSNKKELKKVRRMIEAFLGVVSIIMVFLALLDICKDTYCVETDIKSIELVSEVASSHRININHTLICKTKNGEIYECYDYLYSFEQIEESLGNNCIVYGKHSRLLLDWIKKD